ncbi:NAD(P)-binding protein [uncultured Fusobacterium sp.]|uniref:NAD(P)-binding protein n=1 Tax=uncultured Fusobacterium sp. TaxID=159267 RepID=UPI0025EBDAA0|nr:NAD(P)-binding protein [uncultured Fusobacterium sp.]
MQKFDYLIVGTGLYGSIFAYEMNKKGNKCLVIDKRNHIGGNIYTEEIVSIQKR